VVTLTERQWVALSLSAAELDASARAVDRVLKRLNETPQLDRLWAPDVDSDPARHRAAHFEVFADAGLEPKLARALYDTESDAGLNPFAADAGAVLRQLHEHGVQISVLSDIHFDIRPAFEQAGLADVVDHFVLSFEHNMQKPNSKFFERALSAMGLVASEVLMVGDRAMYDGAAVNRSITTLLLPPLTSTTDRRLDLVSKLAL
jgi:FMN phosphatase YigB (HAD superfamily)